MSTETVFRTCPTDGEPAEIYVDTGKAAGLSANDLINDSSLDVPSGTSVVNGVPVRLRLNSAGAGSGLQ